MNTRQAFSMLVLAGIILLSACTPQESGNPQMLAELAAKGDSAALLRLSHSKTVEEISALLGSLQPIHTPLCNQTETVAESSSVWQGIGLPRLAQSADGIVHLSYADMENAFPRRLFHRSFQSGQWSSPERLLDSPLSIANTVLIPDPKGGIFLLSTPLDYSQLYSKANTDIFVFHRTPNTLHWSQPEKRSVPIGFAIDFDASIAANGDLHLIGSPTSQDLKVSPDFFYEVRSSTGNWKPQKIVSQLKDLPLSRPFLGFEKNKVLIYGIHRPPLTDNNSDRPPSTMHVRVLSNGALGIPSEALLQLPVTVGQHNPLLLVSADLMSYGTKPSSETIEAVLYKVNVGSFIPLPSIMLPSSKFGYELTRNLALAWAPSGFPAIAAIHDGMLYIVRNEGSGTEAIILSAPALREELGNPQLLVAANTLHAVWTSSVPEKKGSLKHCSVAWPTQGWESFTTLSSSSNAGRELSVEMKNLLVREVVKEGEEWEARRELSGAMERYFYALSAGGEVGYFLSQMEGKHPEAFYRAAIRAYESKDTPSNLKRYLAQFEFEEGEQWFPPRQREENDIREAVFRAFLNTEDRSTTAADSFVACLGIATPDGAVSPDANLMRRFAAHKSWIRPMGDCGSPKFISHTTLSSIRWINSDRVKLQAGHGTGPLSGAGYVLAVEKKKGKWVITSHRQRWIS